MSACSLDWAVAHRASNCDCVDITSVCSLVNSVNFELFESWSACNLDWAAAHRVSNCDCVEIISDIFLSSESNASLLGFSFAGALVDAGLFSEDPLFVPELRSLSILARGAGLLGLAEVVLFLGLFSLVEVSSSSDP